MRLPAVNWLRAILLLILLLALLAGVILVRQQQLVKKRAAVPSATLSFAPTNFENLSAGDPVNPAIFLDTGGQETVGVDAVVDFNKDVLELTGVTPTTTSFQTFAPIVSQTDCSFNLDVGQANSTGRVEFGAVTFDCGSEAITSRVNGSSVQVASLNFRVKSGAVNGTYSNAIRFRYTAGSTIDSNVVHVETGTGGAVTDILKTASSKVDIAVGGAVASPTPGGIPGDTDGNGCVNIFDFNNVISHYGETGSGILGDTDGDGDVDIFDFNTVISHYGEGTCP